MKTKLQIAIFFLLLTQSIAQKPCFQYQYDELGCVSSFYESCSWNHFLSSCQQTYSTNIGCSLTLNRLACINQLQYANQDWAYCLFSGYCRDITGVMTDCLSSLSKPACLAVVGKACLWANQCLEMTLQQLATAIQEAQNSITILNESNIVVCQYIEYIAVMHQTGANQYLIQLIDNSDRVTAQKYFKLLQVLGCLEIDANILNLIGCTDAGINSVACTRITTPGQKCQFFNNACHYVYDFLALNCYDLINKEACLSATNINQPCYWSNNKCQLYSGIVACNLKIFPVSPSFCAAAVLNKQDCFYNVKKQKCSSLCSLFTSKKTCNNSQFNCIYANNSCLFKGLKSQCGLIGQNRQSCMNAKENCSFTKGFCLPMKDLSIVKCGESLNRLACLNVTKVGQLCHFYNDSCQSLIINYWDLCIFQSKVNENVCKRMTDSPCYWKMENCVKAATNISCTEKGLNKIGCFASTQTECQWDVATGSCQNVVINNDSQCQFLTLVNANACKMINYQVSKEINQLCKYNDLTHSCETFIAEIAPQITYKINCLISGLNKAGCLSVADPTIACRWTSQGCVQITSTTSQCSGLMNITAKVCALVVDEPCTYDAKQKRCTTSVNKNPYSCTNSSVLNKQVLNGQACAFIMPLNGGNCYFDSQNLECKQVVSSSLSTLECVKSYPNQPTCLKIRTLGQKCQWNVQKSQCEQLKTPNTTSCESLTNVGVNVCSGYENQNSYCVKGDIANTCKKIDTNTPNDNCFNTIGVNLSACVDLTIGSSCYFDTTKMKCISMFSGMDDILLSIQCKQGNQDICDKIKTQDQFCFWNDTLKKCLSEDQCAKSSGKPDCASKKLPCVFKDNKCTLILSNNAFLYNCADAHNEFSCYKVAKQACTYTGGLCNELTVSDTCTNYQNSQQKVNAIACAKTSGEFCLFDAINNQCITKEISANNKCDIGQNKENCQERYNCSFNPITSLCSKTLCAIATTQDNCMNIQSTCMWTTDEQCKLIPLTGNCFDYQQSGYKYTIKTCREALCSENDKICIQNPVTLMCEEIFPNQCDQTSERILCENVRNNCQIDQITLKCDNATGDPKSCEVIQTKYTCLTSQFRCTWIEQPNGLCQQYLGQMTNCQIINSDGTIKQATQIICHESQGCYFDLKKLKCTAQNDFPILCVDAKFPNSCQQISEEQSCYWDTDLTCKTLSDLSQGANLTYAQVANSQKTICLLPQLDGELTQWNPSIPHCIIPNNAYTLCSDFLNLGACLAVENDNPIQHCIYTTSCSQANLNTSLCTDSVNFHACVAITTPLQFCVWRGQRCVALNDDGFTIGKYPAVNMNTCTKTYTIDGVPQKEILNPIGVKFGKIGCVPSEPDFDTCSTPGLNYYGCLQSRVDSCIWSQKQCLKFTQFNMKKCSDFQQVSAGVCISIQDLKCTWKYFNCIDATANQLCSDDLSQVACVMQTMSSCKWENNKCQNQIIIPGVTSCGTDTSSFTTSKYSSIFSCQSVSYGILPCMHNGTGCTIQIDLITAKCNTPGLNAVACTMVKLQNCIFSNNCQPYFGNNQQCRSLIAVSPQVCADITDSTQYCKYSKLTNECIVVSSYDLCTSIGINQSGCNYLSKCKWHKDLNYCSCATALFGVKFCADYDTTTCKKKLNCIISNQNTCRAKLCSDLDSYSCQLIQQCYLTISGNCQSAKTCNDVKYVKDCTLIEINGLKCQTHSQGQCREHQCQDNETVSTCFGDCYWVGTYCDKRVCQSFSKKELCYGTFENTTCYWLNNMCFGISSCYQLASYYEDQITLQKVCKQSIVNGDQCFWQLASQYSNQYECSNNQCNIFGSSTINCVGAEIDYFVCVLSQDFKCMRCEDIVNECECQANKSNCVFYNKKCRSLQCRNYQQQTCELFPDKCMWYSTTNTCFQICSKLGEAECQARDVNTGLCYWQSRAKRCKSGRKPVIDIDTAAIQIREAGLPVRPKCTSSSILFILIIFEFFN